MKVMKNKRRVVRASQNPRCRRPVKAAESYGWVVDESEAWEAYEFACDYIGKETVDDEIIRGLSTDELASSLAYMFRMYEFNEWYDRNGGEEDDIESSVTYSSTRPLSSYEKKQCIEQIAYDYGVSKKQATEWYNSYSDERRRMILDGGKSSAKKSFYND